MAPLTLPLLVGLLGLGPSAAAAPALVLLWTSREGGYPTDHIPVLDRTAGVAWPLLTHHRGTEHRCEHLWRAHFPLAWAAGEDAR